MPGVFLATWILCMGSAPDAGTAIHINKKDIDQMGGADLDAG